VRVDLKSPSAPNTDGDAGFDLLRADVVRGFPDLVRQLGGDPDALLGGVGLDGGRPDEGAVSCRAWTRLMEDAAQALDCPDFGMRLATLQGGGEVFGAVAPVMLNSKTFGEGLEFVGRHSHAHSLAVRMRLEHDAATGDLFSSYHILVDRQAHWRQAIEQVLLLGHLNAVASTGGRGRVREVRFRHQPLSPLRTYRRYFGCEVLFDQQEDGVVYHRRDLEAPIVDADARAYETAKSLIDSRFPPASPPLHVQVRGVMLQFLGTEYCNPDDVGAELGLHRRTLHRRLRAEGRNFLEIRDAVRRETALYYVQETDTPLAHVAQKLGYAEHSVFSRTFQRWFGASPRSLRAAARRRPLLTA
jgi:AraC-like DNA-binding protein